MKPSARRVLRELRRVGDTGSTTGVLCRPEVGGTRFSARIKELRDAGCVIENVRERNGSDRYWLRSEPPGLLSERAGRPADQVAAPAEALAPADAPSAAATLFDQAGAAA